MDGSSENHHFVNEMCECEEPIYIFFKGPCNVKVTRITLRLAENLFKEPYNVKFSGRTLISAENLFEEPHNIKVTGRTT